MKKCLALLLIALSTSIAQAAHAVDGRQEARDAEGITRLQFGGAAPHPGALAISADGRIAAHISSNGDILLWDPTAERLLETIPANGKKPSAVALNRDGSLVAIGYFDSRVIAWSRREHKVLKEFNGHSGGVSALAFSRNDGMLASGGDDGTAQVWDLSPGRRLHVFDSEFGGAEHSGGLVASLGFSGNERVLVVNEWYSRFYDVGRGSTLWDLNGGIEISTREVAPPNVDNAMRAGQAMGGQGWILAYTGNDGLMVERLDQCRSARQLPFGGFADTVAVDPRGRWVAAAESHKLTFSPAASSGTTYPVALPGKAIALVAHPDGRSVLALMIAETRRNGNEHFIFGRDAETVTGGALFRIPVPAALWQLPPLAVKEGATHCVPSDTDRQKQDYRLAEKPLELIPIATLVPTKAMTTDPENPDGEYNKINPPRELYFAADGSLYALYDANSNFRSGVAVWDVETKQLRRARFHKYGLGSPSPIRLREGWGSVADNLTNILTGKPFSTISNRENRNEYIRVASDVDTGAVFQLAVGRFEHYNANGQQQKNLPLSGTVIAFTARNGRLAALYSDGRLQIWPYRAGGESRVYRLLKNELDSGGCGIPFVNLSADGNYVQIPFECVDSLPYYEILRVTGKRVGGGELLTPFLGQSSLGVVPGNRPHHLAVWDFDKGEIIAYLPRHRSRDQHGGYKPLRAAFSSDGRWLASVSFDGLLRIWDLPMRNVVGEGRVGGEVTAMSYDEAGRLLAVGRADGQLFVFQMPEPTN